jgi:hypothetical protein
MQAMVESHPIAAWKVFTNYPDLYESNDDAWRLDDGDPRLQRPIGIDGAQWRTLDSYFGHCAGIKWRGRWLRSEYAGVEAHRASRTFIQRCDGDRFLPPRTGERDGAHRADVHGRDYVVAASYDASGYDYYILVDYGEEFASVYAHASKLYVGAAQAVSQGRNHRRRRSNWHCDR